MGHVRRRPKRLAEKLKKIRTTLGLSQADIKLISSKLFINVTKAAREDRHLAKTLNSFKNL